ncbi:MAG TPA: MerR family transcriptional regulator [Actinocrinis sp.]|nr:MerR family transcriptional regulator [Actinocrinis sp.]
MEDAYLTIGEAAARFRLAASTLRYWEQRGILLPAEISTSRRLYGPQEMHRIAQIQIWQDIGLTSLNEIAGLLAGLTDGYWRNAVQGRIEEIDEQIERLTTAKTYLGHYLACPQDRPAKDCPLLRREVEEYIDRQTSRTHSPHDACEH